jgi:GST-like protein
MLTLYAWPTPNGQKLFLMLEELGEAYETRFVNIAKNEQFEPAFLKIAPNNKIPAIVDPDAADGPLALFESGAILQYLADKHGRFIAPSGKARWHAIQWLHWQIGGFGPMLGQLGYFGLRAQEKVPPAISRFTEEASRLLGVLDGRLGEARYLAGDEYSIADIATYPWARAAASSFKALLGDAVSNAANFARWLDEVGARPAVERAMAIKPPA